ncbi:glycosyltransferase family 4 protein [Zavarzinia sp. CC-PAN008]|uniref:glycosyltransferase family 4 protein n=1 Tax=Zavarzinia sp. CC-PAN008 TaxID=3243332 RepID=UPI003F747249
MDLLIVSDAWAPQVNGVVRTLESLVGELARAGHRVSLATPDRFRSVACPTDPAIRLAVLPRRRLVDILGDGRPAAIHVATEGPLGIAARRLCLKRGLRFTTAYHTRFPEYLKARVGVPLSWSYAWLRRFHAPSGKVMVATDSVRRELAAHGFRNLAPWTRGVDLDLFRPDRRNTLKLGLEPPVFLYVGRLAIEKNVAAFLALDLPGSKLVVGDGPDRARLEALFPQARFVGQKSGEDLARHYAAADVMVFPSVTDTFGLVLLEALASGVPVAAFPVPGPRDVLTARTGVMDTDLRRAALAALDLSPDACRAHARTFSWAETARQFVANLECA